MKHQQIWARIKKSSKYFDSQQEIGNDKKAVPFPVFFQPGRSEYCVQCQGNQYRLADVNLFIIDELTKSELRIC